MNERGQAATEVVLSLSFFAMVMVMVIGMNFGKAFLLQHQAIVAARYAAWQEARSQRPVSTGEATRAGYGGNQLRLRSIDVEEEGGDWIGNVAKTVEQGASSLLGATYGDLPTQTTTAYTVSYRWRPLGRVLPVGHPSGRHVVNLEDWRHAHVPGEGGVLGWLRSSQGWILQVISF